MELVGSSSLFSWSFIFGGGGGGGGLMLPTPDEEEDVEDETIGPEVILNSGSVLNTIVEVCMLLHFCLFTNESSKYLLVLHNFYSGEIQSQEVPLKPLNKSHAVFPETNFLARPNVG